MSALSQRDDRSGNIQKDEITYKYRSVVRVFRLLKEFTNKYDFNGCLDVCEDFQDISDEMSSAEKRNIEDKDSAMSVAFEAGEPSSSITSIQVDETYECKDSETDLYLLDVSATIAEMEGEEIEEEFDDALVEIAGVKSFPCHFTRHFNSKHG